MRPCCSKPRDSSSSSCSPSGSGRSSTSSRPTPTLCRNLPKGIWLIVVVILADIGALAWLLLGRPAKGSWRPVSTDFSSRRPVGYEDQPRFNATPEVITDRRSEELDRRLDVWEAEQRAKNADLDRREAELRERELTLREREIEKRERESDS